MTKKHRKIKEKAKKIKFACKNCSKSFASVGGLEYHEQKAVCARKEVQKARKLEDTIKRNEERDAKRLNAEKQRKRGQGNF